MSIQISDEDILTTYWRQPDLFYLTLLCSFINVQGLSDDVLVRTLALYSDREAPVRLQEEWNQRFLLRPAVATNTSVDRLLKPVEESP